MARILPLIFIASSLYAFELAKSTTEFITLVDRLCQKKCGVDPHRDQEERQWVLDWMQNKEFKEHELKAWIGEDRRTANPRLTKEKMSFILARFKEKKSPLVKIFE